MSGFSAAWLGLREPVDHAARSLVLSDLVARRLVETVGEVTSRRPVRILDLATGTGSNPRYLSPHLPAYQEWTLLDADTDLLTALPTRMAAWATRLGGACIQGPDGIVVKLATTEVRMRPRSGDISRFPIPVFQDRPSLITASALLDLVSDSWLRDLVAGCREAGATVLFALTYDGRTTLSPAHPDDARVVQLVNRHQTGEKGFGPALGPEATSRAAAYFQAAGYEVQRERSDWMVGPSARALQDELIAGWVNAACEMAPAEVDRLRAWERERRETAAAGGLEIMVGHEDLAAWPMPRDRRV